MKLNQMLLAARRDLTAFPWRPRKLFDTTSVQAPGSLNTYTSEVAPVRGVLSYIL